MFLFFWLQSKHPVNFSNAKLEDSDCSFYPYHELQLHLSFGNNCPDLSPFDSICRVPRILKSLHSYLNDHVFQLWSAGESEFISSLDRLACPVAVMKH